MKKQTKQGFFSEINPANLVHLVKIAVQNYSATERTVKPRMRLQYFQPAVSL